MLKVNENTKNLISTLQTQYTNKIKKLEENLKKNNVELKELKIELEEKNCEIAQQHEVCEHIRQKMLEMQQPCVEEKNGQITKNSKENEKNKNLISELHKKIENLEFILEQKNNELNVKSTQNNETYNAYAAELELLKKELENREEIINGEKNEIIMLKTEVQNIKTGITCDAKKEVITLKNEITSIKNMHEKEMNTLKSDIVDKKKQLKK